MRCQCPDLATDHPRFQCPFDATQTVIRNGRSYQVCDACSDVLDVTMTSTHTETHHRMTQAEANRLITWMSGRFSRLRITVRSANTV